MEDIEAIAVLQDPVRRRLYDYVAAQDHEVSRNEAAEGAGIQRTLAAFHLDKLVDAGLLETESRRLTGRSGPGAGRPAKLYRRSEAERQFSVPARDYRVAADLLAEVAEAARLDTELQAAARREGRAAAGPIDGFAAAEALLAARGYEPRMDGEVLRLTNCPFHVLSERHPTLVCGMNLALLEGLTEGTDGLRARMDPRPGLCCVVVEISKNKSD
ncbi:metalloregulator ArsR/SmtB family transcription factor [Kutzneria buriramensis]|uniref:Putative ArsR family transcriptional regulator n=1 Tax=Kutzneria buriramensis TaxID=1045776 RepID=A0A3E0HHX1_9PSEU|nr:helix-turn-helix domain-containing protein [Kutzneria buriramensis]REH46008.1 putative ArsR family transcriptional regulator [Kutzneria buriramensis]